MTGVPTAEPGSPEEWKPTTPDERGFPKQDPRP